MHVHKDVFVALANVLKGRYQVLLTQKLKLILFIRVKILPLLSRERDLKLLMIRFSRPPLDLLNLFLKMQRLTRIKSTISFWLVGPLVFPRFRNLFRMFLVEGL